MNRIKYYRKLLDLSLQQLAEKVYICSQHINRMEKGERRVATEHLKRFADAFGCYPSDLLHEDWQRPLDVDMLVKAIEKAKEELPEDARGFAVKIAKNYRDMVSGGGVGQQKTPPCGAG